MRGITLKTRTAGTAKIEVRKYDNVRICPVALINYYLDKTADPDRDDHLFVSMVKPHKAVHIDTVRRWITTVMQMAGIDVGLFKPHSTRAAVT